MTDARMILCQICSIGPKMTFFRDPLEKYGIAREGVEVETMGGVTVVSNWVLEVKETREDANKAYGSENPKLFR